MCIRDSNILATDNDKTKRFKNKCKRSEEKGIERKDRLDEFTKKNQWIDVFYAEHTFEVDFLLESNSYEVIEMIPDIYASEKKQKEVEIELETETSETGGKRILTMANNIGKGWFAILLGKYITFKTYIPDYIINALIFATPEIKSSTLKDILQYRINKNEDESLKKTKKELVELEKGDSTLKKQLKHLIKK